MKNTLCIIVALFIFSINAKGQCTLSVSFSSIQGTNGNVSFSSTVTGGTAPYNYQWNFGNDSLGSNDPNPTFTFPANYTYNVCLSVYDSLRVCQGTFCQPVTVTSSQTINCTGITAFTVSPNGVLTDINFTQSTLLYRIVYFGDGTITEAYGNLAEHGYILNGNYTVKCFAYSLMNNFVIYCDSTIQNITVSNVPCHADFSMSVDTFHQASSFTFTNMSTGYQHTKWYLNGNVIATDTNTVFTGQLPPGKYNICLVINGPNGCTDSICKIDSLIYTPLCPGVNFGDSELSSPCDTYQFTTTNAGSLTSVQWDEDGTPFSTQPNPQLTLNFANALHNIQGHTITVTAIGNGCQSTGSFTILNPGGFNVQLHDSISHVWDVYPYNYGNTASEIWDFGDGTTSTQAFPTHTYAVAGNYTLCHHLVLTNGCTYDYCYSGYFYRQDGSNYVIEIIVLSPTGIKEVSKANAFHCYPNPVSDDFNIVSDAVLSLETTLTVFNSLGQLVKTENVTHDGLRFVINVKSLPFGVYYFNVMDNHSILNRGKIVVVK